MTTWSFLSLAVPKAMLPGCANLQLPLDQLFDVFECHLSALLAVGKAIDGLAIAIVVKLEQCRLAILGCTSDLVSPSMSEYIPS